MDYKGMKTFIGVGSNIDPEHNIAEALKRLSTKVDITGVSSFYKTRPLLNRDQDDFLNGVWQVSVSMSPRELKFKVLNTIETELHRVRRSDRYVSRTIDLDLLLFGDFVIREEDLVIPDPDIYKRSFIAYPLFELSPDLVVPDTKTPLTTIRRLLARDSMIPDIPLTEALRRIAKV